MGVLANLRECLFNRCHMRFDAFHQVPGCISGFSAATRTTEQLDIQFLFKQFDLSRKRWLSHANRQSRFGNARMLAHS